MSRKLLCEQIQAVQNGGDPISNNADPNKDGHQLIHYRYSSDGSRLDLRRTRGDLAMQVSESHHANLPLAVVVRTAHSERVSLVPSRLFPPVVVGVVDLRFEVLVWIDDPPRFWPLVLRYIHRIELLEIRCLESQRRCWHRRVGLMYRDIHLWLNR